MSASSQDCWWRRFGGSAMAKYAITCQHTPTVFRYRTMGGWLIGQWCSQKWRLGAMPFKPQTSGTFTCHTKQIKNTKFVVIKCVEVENAPKPFSTLRELRAYDAPPDRLVGWERDTPSHSPPLENSIIAHPVGSTTGCCVYAGLEPYQSLVGA